MTERQTSQSIAFYIVMALLLTCWTVSFYRATNDQINIENDD